MPTCPQGSWLMWQVTVLASPAACHLREPPSDRSESVEREFWYRCFVGARESRTLSIFTAFFTPTGSTPTPLTVRARIKRNKRRRDGRGVLGYSSPKNHRSARSFMSDLRHDKT